MDGRQRGEIVLWVLEITGVKEAATLSLELVALHSGRAQAVM